MTDMQAEANARADPDNPPLDTAALSAMRRVPRVKVIRRALGLTQQAFAERFAIPLGTLRDWEQGRSSPDAPARAYLNVIAVNPEAAAEAIRKGAT
ncbi:helix-turn-helix domain-containing protein [Pseudohoeflea suaedae]|uniref:Helix-turn-helix domain-containing protein n=1 Tax=Pseudohoeflea suaedae TaxID=877384 RepID=A0A4R5PQ61_9HYPH|nr:helix-turn-helix domain-containing protein [Pseudohoeflea suaedae]TDH39013.1 helix-turn-helix domain-containing protein [Pseudohoeflea suaedae]